MRKIKSLIDPKEIKYLVCHHQDPDITACISKLEEVYPRDDRMIVTHWRTQALLKHYNWKSSFYIVDRHDWKLELQDGRVIRFIFTPYAHFSGAFCSYDVKPKVLFSSDIFGGFVTQDRLFAESRDNFEDLKLFHEHYMPSTNILRYALKQIRKLELNLIAPQHGYIIPKRLIPMFIDLLNNLECGLFKLSRETEDVAFLSRVGELFQRINSILIENISFENILQDLLKTLDELFQVKDLFIIAFSHPETELYHPGLNPRRTIVDSRKGEVLKKFFKLIADKPFHFAHEKEFGKAVHTSVPYYILLPLTLSNRELGIAFWGS